MKKQRILSALLTLCLVFSLLPTALAVDADDFTDVGKDSWCYDYVDYVTSKGYFLGTTDTTFSPDRNMTRAMFVVVLARFDGVKVDNSRSSFTDVEPGAWCAGAIEWAADEEIVTGYADGTFKPNAPITRAQMCAIMDRYLDYYTAKHKVTVAQKGDAAKLTDQSQVPAYATKAVKNCQKYGLIYGYEDGTFRPQANSTRAHVAAIIYRLAFLVADAKPVKETSGGGGGGGSSSHKNTYKITYDLNYAGASKLTGYTEKTTASKKAFTTLDAQTRDGYAFTSWNTKADGSGDPYAAACDYTATGNMTLYAQWIKDDDYIGLAVSAAMMQLNEEYINSARLEYDGNAAILVPVTFNGSETDDETVTRNQYLNARMSVTDEAVADIITLASGVACGLVDVTREDLPSRDDVNDMVRDIIAAIEEATGLVITKETTIAEIQDQVYQILLDEGKSMWSNFYDENGDYYCGDITVTAGSYSATIKVDQANHATTLDGSKREAVKKISAYIAREMYASLREASNGEYINEAILTATVDVTFADNSSRGYGAATAKYPHKYPVTISLLLQGNELIAYKFAEKSYVKLNVTGKIQTAYEDGVESIAVAVKDSDRLANMLRPVIKDTLEQDNTFEKLKEELDKKGVTLTATNEEVIEALTGGEDGETVVDQWMADNLDKLFDYLWTDEGDVSEDGEELAGVCDNSVLVETIWSLVVDDIPGEDEMKDLIRQEIEEQLASAGITEAWIVEMANESDMVNQAKDLLNTEGAIIKPADLKLDIENIADINALMDIPTVEAKIPFMSGYINADVENFGDSIREYIISEAEAALIENLEGTAFEEIVNSNTNVKSYLIYSALVSVCSEEDPSVHLDFDAEKAKVEDKALEALMDEDSGMISSFAQSYIDEKIGGKVQSAIGGKLNGEGNFAKLLDARKFKTYEGMAQVKFSNVVTLLRSDLLADLIGSRGDSYVDSYLAKVIGKLPAGASVTIDGVEIDKDALDELAKAETTVEACEALADILEDFGGLSVDSFAEPGIPVEVSYNERSFAFNLVIEAK